MILIFHQDKLRMFILSFRISVRTIIWILLNILSDFVIVTYVSCFFLLIKWVQSVQSLSHVWLFAIPWTAACQASLSITNSEFTQTHVHWISDTIQPFHPLSFPSLPSLNLSQHQGLFQWISSSHQVVKVLEFQLRHQHFQWIFKTVFL